MKKYLIDLSYLLLFPIFFILHGYNDYFYLIPSTVLVLLAIKYIFVILVLAFISFFIFDEIVGLLFVFFLLCIYFFFGAAHDWLKHVFKYNKISSYSIILPCIVLIIFTTGFCLRKTRIKLDKARSFVKTLLSILVCWEVMHLIINWSCFTNSTNNLILADTKLLFSNTEVQDKPDIYFIVFDEYTSSIALKEYLNFKNNSLDSLLSRNNFFLSSNSQSNFNLTPFSLASTLGMNYLNIHVNPDTTSTKGFLKAIYSVKHNPLIPFLKNEGYDIMNIGYLDFKDQRTKRRPYFDHYYTDAIDNQTLISRIRRDIWWNFLLRVPFSNEIRIPNSYKKNKQEYIERNYLNYEELVNELKTESNTPKFVYAHIMLPHEPFFLKADGTFFSDTAILTNSIEPRNGYINQVIYANQLIKKLIPLCVRKTNRKRIVIIEGDHGYRFYSDNVPLKKLFMNFNAYYFSDHDYTKLYDSISPINTFRVVLKKYFNQQIPLLKDSSTLLVDPRYDVK